MKAFTPPARRRGFGAAAGFALCLAVQFTAAHAHDAIGAKAHKTYVTKLDELHRGAQSPSAPSVRAAALFQIGITLDEIRELLNRDMASHGKPQGLSAALLVDQLNTMPHKLVYSSRMRLYQANLAPYREAIALDPRGAFVDTARFMILKGHFYDSFTDDPLRPSAQTREELLAMIDIGEALYRARTPGLDHEETGFILALHYLQARLSRALAEEKATERFAELLREFRQRHPTSLKLATLEALGP